MKYQLILGGLAALLAASCNTSEKSEKIESQLDSVSYSMGASVANNLKNQKIDSLNVVAFKQGMEDVFSDNDLQITEDDGRKIINNYFTGKQKEQADANLKKGQEFLAKNRTKDGVIETKSGLQYEVIKEGTGPKPTLQDKVTVNYHGTLLDGTVFDSSVDRGKPVTFPVGGVIPGWQEALQLMNVGSKYKLYVPPSLAYGEKGAGGMIGPNETLVFEVELLSIEGK